MEMREWIAQNKIIVICRKLYGEPLIQLSDALLAGGIKLMEVTFDQVDPDCLHKTAEAIAQLEKRHSGKLFVGAGTVLNVEQVNTAANAGARYIISPNFSPAVVRRTKELGLVSIPGALTPTEICAAHDAGADFVKLFPAGWLGLSYIKDILAPISHIPLIATGGVNEENFGEYLKLGFAGAGVSGRLADKKLLERGDVAEITRRAKFFVDLAGEVCHG